ncbi:MAG: hypothetical protein WC473_00435 [Patescibacteria group bacterium]
MSLLFLLFLSGCSIGKYESMTAEEWSDNYYESEDKYDKFRSCVEDYDSLSFQEKNQYGGVFYYCE